MSGMILAMSDMILAMSGMIPAPPQVSPLLELTRMCDRIVPRTTIDGAYQKPLQVWITPQPLLAKRAIQLPEMLQATCQVMGLGPLSGEYRLGR